MSTGDLFSRWCRAWARRRLASGQRTAQPAPGVEALEERLTPDATRLALDFGTATSPVQSEYTAVLKEGYTVAKGFGWANFGQTWLHAFDSGTGTPLTRDGHLGLTSGTFLADLVNGSYRVTVTLGDALDARDQMALVAEGQRVAENITTLRGQQQRISFVVDVNDGQLDLRFLDEGGKHRYFSVAALEAEVVGVTAPPTASAGPDLAGNEGAAVKFNGAATGAGLSYHWDFGDGTTQTGALTPEHTYKDNGTYTATLTVTDELGQTVADRAQVIIGNVAPTATFSSTGPVEQGKPVTLAFGNQADPSPVDVAARFLYSYDFNNDGTFDLLNVLDAGATFTFAESGTHTVRGRITDKDGGASEYTTTVEVTDPIASDVSVTVKPGLWSDPSVWNVPPTRDRDVVINHDIVIDSGEARRVDIMAGTTTLAGTLHAYGSVVVHATLTGTQGALLFHVANDRLFVGNTKPGPDPTNPDDHSDTDIGLWGMEDSTVKLVGPEVTPWLNAVPKSSTGAALGYGGVELPTIGGGTVTLERAPVGWQAGDTLLLTSVRGNYVLARLIAVDGAVVTYQELNQAPGTFQAGTILAEGRYARPKVANLTRRLLIASADVREGDTTHRAHTVFMHHAHIHLNNVEFRDLGPRGKLGRYPVHFHHTGHALHDSGLVGSSIWQSVSEAGNRFVAIHASQGLTVSNNVALRSHGHGFFMEDGTEVGNKVVGNLSVDVRGLEELPVRNGDLAPGAHHYWMRSGNTIERNVAVGGTHIGMVLLPEVNPDVVAGDAVATDNEFYGVGKYAVWSAGVVNYQVRMLATFSGEAGVGESRYPTFASMVIDDATLLYNGLPGSVYASQVYMNQGKDITVRGGVLVGETAVHVHYETTFTIENATIRGRFLVEPTYWELGGVFRNSDIQVDTLFKRAYPKRRHTPGLVRLQNITGRVGTTTYTATSALTADFTHDSAPRVPGFTGTVIENGVRRLSALAPASGFLRTPSLPRFSTWSVVSAGTPTGTFLNLSESEEGWRNSSASLGYYDGLPPGTYDVTIKTRDGRTMAYRGVEVRAGEVTDLNALQPVVTFSTELSASKALRINRAADGSFTVERTYTVQGKPAATDFVISYYYSTDPYGKTNVTYLGSETISSTADKSLGEHTATSPSFKITTSGTYYVFARIDTDGVIEENDETDNLFAPIKIVI